MRITNAQRLKRTRGKARDCCTGFISRSWKTLVYAPLYTFTGHDRLSGVRMTGRATRALMVAFDGILFPARLGDKRL